MLSSPYGDPLHRSGSPSIPLELPSDEEYTIDAPFGNPSSSARAAHIESFVPSSYDEGGLFSSTTTVESGSSDGSRTLTPSDNGHVQSDFVAGKSHTNLVSAPGVTVVKKFSFENHSPSGTREQTSVFKFKFFNRSLPRLVSTPKQPSIHPFNANEDTTPSLLPLSISASSVDLTHAEVLTLPSIWLITPTPIQPGFSSPIVPAGEPTQPSASSPPSSPVLIYEPTIPEISRTRRYLEKKPLPTIPTVGQRQSVMVAFVRRLGNAMGFKREPIQGHSHVYDKSGVDKKARLHSQRSTRIQTYSFDPTTNGRLTTTAQTAGRQADQGMAGIGASEAILDREARRPSQLKIGRLSRALHTGGESGIYLEGIVTDFVGAENAKRSGTGSAVEGGRQESGSEHPPPPV